MVKARKINVVDLNEIGPINTQEATHTETVAPIETTPEVEDVVPTPIEEVLPTPIEEVPPPTVKEVAPEKKVEVVAPESKVVMKKNDEKATCTFCNKVMTVKALKYSHDKNCKGKQPTEAPKALALPEPTPRTNKNHRALEVSSDAVDEPSTPRHSEPLIQPKAKMTRAELRQQRLNNLVSQAF